MDVEQVVRQGPQVIPMSNVLGARLKSLRLKHSRSQQALGGVIGYSSQMVSDMELGIRYSERYCVMFMSTICRDDSESLLTLMRKKTMEIILNRATM